MGEKLTRLQIPDFHRQLQRGDIICRHQPLRTAAAPVLHAKSRDRRPAVCPRDPGDVRGTLCRHGDGGPVRSLRHWKQTQIREVRIRSCAFTSFLQAQTCETWCLMETEESNT